MLGLRVVPGFIAGLSSGAAFSQFPAYVDQYQRYVAGRISDAQAQAEAIRKAAEQSGQTLDAFLSEQGPETRDVLAIQLGRPEKLQAASDALANAEGLDKPLAFLSHFDAGLAGKVSEQFEPSLQIGLEGLAYLGIGALFGLLLVRLLFVLIRWLLFGGRRRRRRFN